MKTAIINVKVDEKIKRRAKAVAGNFGIPLSTLVNAYLVELANTGQIHFATTEPMTKEMEKVIAQAEREIKTGKTSGPFDTLEAAYAHLDSLK